MKNKICAQASIPSAESIWQKAKKSLAGFTSGADQFFIDVSELRLIEVEGGDEEALAKALDEIPVLAGWRELDILYLWPQ